MNSVLCDIIAFYVCFQVNLNNASRSQSSHSYDDSTLPLIDRNQKSGTISRGYTPLLFIPPVILQWAYCLVRLDLYLLPNGLVFWYRRVILHLRTVTQKLVALVLESKTGS